jgi:PEGA domain-containing protein
VESSSLAPVAEGPTNGASPIDTVAVSAALDEVVVRPVVPLSAAPEVAPPDAPEIAGLEGSASADAEMSASNTEHAPNVGDPFDSFNPERKPIAPVRPRAPLRRIPVAVVGLCAAVGAGWIAWQTGTAMPAASAPVSAASTTGTADFHSVPEGASVAIDGRFRGVTPLRVSVAAGTHNVTITSGAVSRTLPLTVTPGGTVSQYVELATAPAAVGGRLEIGSEPPGAMVAIDGTAQGSAPLVIADIAPGRYRITVSAGGNVVNRTVNVTRGTTSTLVVSTAPVAANTAAGWLTIESPVDMDILENGRVIGNTRLDPLMLPVGVHRIELANAGLEFTAARTVEIAAGKTANVVIALPSGRLSVNAIPWAEVSLKGVSLGTTPLGDLAVPIGTHELVFRHPQFGERRHTVTVKAQTVARVGIDLRK